MIDFSRKARPFVPVATAADPMPNGAIFLGSGPDGIAWVPPPTLQRTANLTIAAQAGGGKTALLSHAVSSALGTAFEGAQPSQARGFVVMDPKGDLIDYSIAGLSCYPRVIPHLRYCNIFARRGGSGAIPLNFVKAASLGDPPELIARGVAHLLARTSVAGGILAVAPGHRQMEVLVAAIAGAYDADHVASSLLFSVDCLELPDGPERLARLCRSERVRAQVLGIAAAGSEAKLGALSRLRAALTGWDELERQIGAPTCVSFADLTAPGCTFIDLSDAPANSTELVNVYGNLLCSEIMRFLLARPTGFPGHNATVLVDEALQFTDALSSYGRRIYEVGRSKAVSCWLAVQQLRGLRDTGALYHAIVANCTSSVYGRQGHEDAMAAVREATGHANSPEAARLVADLVSMPAQQFVLVQPGKRTRFSAADIDFRAWEASARAREADISAALMRLSTPLPPPVRLHEVGGPRGQVPANVQPVRRGRSFLG